jgi:large subunit ribosomal protein L18
MYAQLINDETGTTLVSAHSKAIKGGDAGDRTGKVAAAYLVGMALAEKAKAAGVESIVFDRAGYQYQGRVQAVADGARDGGLTF